MSPPVDVTLNNSGGRPRPSPNTGWGTMPWACPDHLEGLTGLREFGRRRCLSTTYS